MLVLGWGSTWGAITAGVRRVRLRGRKVSHVHLTHLNPFPRDLGEILKSYRKVLVPEVNLGQLSMLLRARFLIDVRGFNRVRGKPFRIIEIKQAAEELLGEN